MRRSIMLALVLVLMTTISWAQESDSLQTRLDSLLLVRDDLRVRLGEVEQEVFSIEGAIAKQEFERLVGEGIAITLRREGPLRSRPVFSNALAQIPSGTVVTAIGFADDYWLVEYDGQTGYVSDVFIVQTEVATAFKAKASEAIVRASFELNSTPTETKPRTTTQGSSSSSGCRVWVSGYTRRNGTRVRGHWRRKPGC